MRKRKREDTTTIGKHLLNALTNEVISNAMTNAVHMKPYIAPAKGIQTQSSFQVNFPNSSLLRDFAERNSNKMAVDENLQKAFISGVTPPC